MARRPDGPGEGPGPVRWRRPGGGELRPLGRRAGTDPGRRTLVEPDQGRADVDEPGLRPRPLHVPGRGDARPRLARDRPGGAAVLVPRDAGPDPVRGRRWHAVSLRL